MAHISTLVQDIYKMLQNGVKVPDEVAKDFGNRVSKMLVDRLSPDREAKGGLRMSSLGKPCDRSLWYSTNTPELQEKLEPWVLHKFLYGDLIEELTLTLAELSGHEVKGRQDELQVQGILGHRDAVIDGVTVDVKSASSRGMYKFKNHLIEKDDPFGYLDQLSLYMHAAKDDPLVKVKGEGAFLAVDKEMGHLVLDFYRKKNIDWEARVESKKKMVAEELPPPRPYKDVPDGLSGNRKLGMECSYCSFKNVCWADSNDGKGLRTFVYATGPRFLTEVKKEPDVMEKKA